MSRAVRHLIAVGLLAVGTIVLAAPSQVAAARTWFVATTGSDAANGTSARPLRSISTAVERAASGDTIEIRGGVYRESVEVFAKRLVVRSRAGERAILDGSRPVTGWRRSGGAFVVDGWTTRFAGSFGPMVLPTYPTAGLPDQVFVDGQPLIQVTARADVAPGRFFLDTAGDRLWIGDDPTGRDVAASNRSWSIYLNQADGSQLIDLTVRRYGTERRDVAAIRAYADDLLLDGVVAEQNAAIGISVIGADVTVRDGRASDNGYLGIHADRATDLTIDTMSVIANNRAGFDSFHSAGGIKVTTSTRVAVLGSDVSFNAGPGIWSDVASRDVTFVGNLTEANLRSGIEVELTAGAVVAGNTSLRNRESGIWVLESSGAEVWNNAAFDNRWQIRVEEGPRRDVAGVTLRNNVVGASATGVELVHVNDWTEQRSYQQMGVTSASTLFWRSGASALSWIGRWPASPAINTTITRHRALAGIGADSKLVGGAMPAVDAGCGDHRVPDGVLTGVPLPTGVASALGVAAGSRRPVGPVAAAPRLRYDWPIDAAPSWTAVGGGTGRGGLRKAVRHGPIPVIPAC